MFDDIHRPKLLKSIPTLLVRALPSIYYYSEFIDQNVSDKAHQLFQTNLIFLSKAVEVFGEHLQNKEFQTLSVAITKLKTLPPGKILSDFEKTTITLSQLCADHKTELRQVLKDQKAALNDLYQQTIKKIQVLVVDNNNEPKKAEKLAAKLSNSCYYSVDLATYNSSGYPQKVIQADFVLFASTQPPHIHDAVNSLKSYHRPGMAVAHIEKEGTANKQAIRHGAQLQKIGFQVLFKIFSPIRLFTNIDKNFMKFHLQQ